MRAQAREELLKKYDAIILAAIEKRPPGNFFPFDLFGPYFWNSIPDDIRGEMEEWFRSRVEQGDFEGVGRTTGGSPEGSIGGGGLQQYYKRPRKGAKKENFHGASFQ
tara:strand:- start:789 stop:1109 length:321 start_codon:yes stop_codon:yes gene_type:complete